MGITGLLQALKPLIQPAHISHFAGKNVAVDGYSWLHKAIYGCCVEICNGNDSDAWIQYCLSFLDVLLDHKLQVIMVFDGDSLPAKSKTELERSESRSSSLNKARALAASGDHKQARSYFSRAVDVTPQMASDLIFVIRSTRPQVQCIVAPYEADAQLAYLSQIGKVDCVISEDSDNIPYGCKQIIFKFERDGSCQTLLLQDIYEKPNDKFDLRSFTQEMVVVMCILAGCDYLVNRSFNAKQDWY
jgi:exonuclease-1